MRIESLERRSLLSTVTWDGGGGDGSFATPANWSNDQLPSSGDDVIVSGSTGPKPGLSGNATYKSLTVGRSMGWGGNLGTLTLNGDLHILPGVTFEAIRGTIAGTGKIIVDVDATFLPELHFGLSQGPNIRMPIDNYGTFGLSEGKDNGTVFHNYGHARVYEGVCYGVFVNEPGGFFDSTFVPTSPSACSIGLQRSADGVVSPAPFINRGTVYSGAKPGTTGAGNSWPLTIYVDGSPTIGGTFYGDQPLDFRAYNTSSTPKLTFDETFSFAAGELQLHGLDATVRGLADNTSLTVDTPHVTLKQSHTSLRVLNVVSGLVDLPASDGTGVLRADNLRLASAGRLNSTDNLIIDGNHPNRLFYDPAVVGPPVALPGYTDSIRGNVNGQILTVNTGVDPAASTSRAVAFSDGAGLASFYPSHAFRGETFDDDDFVFFPTLRGDANFDRSVDFNDLVSLSQHYGLNTSRGFADGNFDSPATASAVDFNDLVLLAQNYGAAFAVAPAIAVAPAATGKATTKRRGDVAGDLSL